jgi:nitroreductase
MTTYDDLLALMKARRSVRYFSDETIDTRTIEKLIALATLTSSIENTQPWEFHVINNPKLKDSLMKTSCYGNFVEGASVFIVITCNKAAKSTTMQTTIWNPRELEYSCAAAIHNIMLGATSMNLGSCWVSLHHGPAHNLLKLKDHTVVVGGLMLGHYKEGEEEASGEHERRPLDDVIHYME